MDASSSTGDGAIAPSEPIIADLVRLVAIWTSSAYQAEFARRAGIDPKLTQLVFHLAVRGPARPGDLVAALRTSAPAVSRAIAELVDAGLAVRAVDQRDRRAATVSLTEAGRAAGRDLVSGGDALLERVVDGWSVDERDAFAAALHRFVDTVETSGP